MGAIRVLRRFGAIVSTFALSAGLAHGFELPNPLARMFGGGGDAKPAEPGRPAPPATAAALECPEILVDAATAALRVPAGADNASVRYQLSLGQVARECSLQGDTLHIKVGVEGAAILGPAGQPGAFGGNLRISARRQKDEAVLQSKTYRVGATVPAGGTRGSFQLIAEPLAVPYLGPHAADDYEILVAFEQGGAEKSEAPKRRKKRAE